MMAFNPIFLLLAILSWTDASPVITRQSLAHRKSQKEFCTHVLNFNNFWYAPEYRKNISGIPADLSVHWKSGNIFFTLISEDMKMSLQVLHPGGDFETVKVAGLGQSITVDNLNDIVYLATDNGVYKYKEDTSIELFTALGEDVMYLAVSNDGNAMYIATWPQNRVHKITNDGQKQESFPLIPNGHGLVIDPRNNIYFVATKTSYILKTGLLIPTKINNLPADKMTGVFVSRSDEVYAMDENSNLYLINSETTSAKHLGCFNVSGVNTFAMDSADNILIGVKDAILKFSAFENNPCSDIFDVPKYFMPTLPSVTEKITSPRTTTLHEMKPLKKKGKRHNTKGKRHNAKKRIVKTTVTTSTIPPTTTSSTEASEEEDEE